MSKKIRVIIPAYNEELSITKVINDIPEIVNEIIVIDNNSNDFTSKKAKDAGATVIKKTDKVMDTLVLKA